MWTSAVTVTLSGCNQMMSWTLMAKFSAIPGTQTHWEIHGFRFSAPARFEVESTKMRPRPLRCMGRGPISLHISHGACYRGECAGKNIDGKAVFSMS